MSMGLRAIEIDAESYMKLQCTVIPPWTYYYTPRRPRLRCERRSALVPVCCQ